MPLHYSLQALLAGIETPDADVRRCKLERIAWVKNAAERWTEAQRQMDDRCTEAAGTMDEAAFERLCDAEQAKVDAIRAQLQAVIDRDEWPKSLYRSL